MSQRNADSLKNNLNQDDRTSDHESKPDAPTEDLKLREERVATYMEVSKDHWDHLQLRLMGSSSAKDGATGSGSSPRSKM